MSFQRGFTLIEVLITAFVLATVTVAITGLGMLSTRSAIEGERKNVAQAIANEEIEIARTYSYAQIEYTDVSPEGKIEREKNVKRNDQDYKVRSIITLKDDPRNGTLPEGTPLTAENADFKQLSVEVSWKRISGGEESSTSSTVVAATFFANKAEDDSCTPGTITCENPNSCSPGAPASCPDETGDYTLDCPATGVCEGKEPFVECPPSGKCSDVGKRSECSDQNDNDSDGAIDLADPGCENAQDNDEGESGQPPGGGGPPGGGPPGQGPGDGGQCQQFGLDVKTTKEVCDLGMGIGEACNDQVDNDEDGGIDWGGSDTDGDGTIDIRPDPDCARALEQSRNGFDDDGDGVIDDSDELAVLVPISACSNTCPRTQDWQRIGPVLIPGCVSTYKCGVQEKFRREGACQTSCNDSLDNDGDGAIDKWDLECTSCMDGIDNEPDGPVDLADPDCTNLLNGLAAGFGEAAYNPQHHSEGFGAGVRECSDTVDNDGDGQIDMGDPGCESPQDDDEACPDDKLDACQKKYGCPDGSCCVDKLIDPQGQCTKANCCPWNRGICYKGTCQECTANNKTKCTALKGIYCDVTRSVDGCKCEAGKCVQCRSDDPNTPDGRDCHPHHPYCYRGSCVECNSDVQCPRPGQAAELKYCRTAACPPDASHKCTDECNNGRDDDRDGTIDRAGLDRDCNGTIDVPADVGCSIGTREAIAGQPGKRPQCSDEDDNDGDRTADFNGTLNFPPDPGCTDAVDDNEQDPLPPGQPVPACNDKADNDGDDKVDWGGFLQKPRDPGCTDGNDNDETDPLPPPPQPGP